MSRQATQRLLDSVQIFRCPMCARRGHNTPCKVRGAAFVCICTICSKQHTYDVSSHGLVNMVPAQKPLQGYTRDFFEARRKGIAQGWYSTLIDEVSDQVLLCATAYYARRQHGCQHSVQSIGDASSDPVPFRVLDVGCGEGSYARAIAQKAAQLYHHNNACSIEVFAMDLSKDAVRVATYGGAGDIRWVVADLAVMPWANQSFDCIINMYSPANYAEFNRIAKPHATLIKVVPGPSHMEQVHSAVAATTTVATTHTTNAGSTSAGSASADSTSADRVHTHAVSAGSICDHRGGADTVARTEHTATQLFRSQVSDMRSTRITQHVPISDTNRDTLSRMTPVLFQRDNRMELVQHIDTITIDGMMLIGTLN